MGCPRFDGLSKYRWPLLCCVCLGDDMCRGVAARRARRSSATPNPGDVAAKAMAKIQRGLIQGQLRGCCPKLELVTVTVAAMAVVATDRQVHRERAATSRRGLMQRANSVPLYPRSLRGLEPKQAQNLLHRDLSANSVEVDTWHGCSSLGDGALQCSRTVPFHYSPWGTGTTPRGRSRDGALQCSRTVPFHYSPWGTGTTPLG